MSLRVASPQYGGAFTVHDDNAPVQAAQLRFVLPGEIVAKADPLTILEPSANRAAPACPHFGICGGCDYQHAAYPAQVELKRTILQQLLEAAGLTALPPIRVHFAAPWQYRNRLRLRVERFKGTYSFGYNRRATRDFLPVVECPISAPILLRAASALLASAASSPVAASWLPSIAEVEFQTNGIVVQATFFTRDNRTNAFAALCDALQPHLPELIGAGCISVKSGYGAKERARWGANGLAFRILDRIYWTTRGGFFQVNTPLLPTMVHLVTSRQAGNLAWDIYAGVGLFSSMLAESFQQVVAVESAPTSSADLTRSAEQNKKSQTVAVQSTVADFLSRAVLQRERPDLIVMDPPRAGLGPKVCALLARIATPQMVYVSCNPTTLARDLTMLVNSGYRIDQVHLLDMFPQTFHLETVVFLKK